MAMVTWREKMSTLFHFWQQKWRKPVKLECRKGDVGCNANEWHPLYVCLVVLKLPEINFFFLPMCPRHLGPIRLNTHTHFYMPQQSCVKSCNSVSAGSLMLLVCIIARVTFKFNGVREESGVTTTSQIARDYTFCYNSYKNPLHFCLF